MILADSISNQVPLDIAAWLGCAFVVMLIVNEAFKLTRNIRGPEPHAPQPPNSELELKLIQLARDIAAVNAALDRHVALNLHEHENLFKKIGGVERGAQARLEASRAEADANLQEAIRAGNESREKLHHRINDLLKAISTLEGKLDR